MLNKKKNYLSFGAKFISLKGEHTIIWVKGHFLGTNMGHFFFKTERFNLIHSSKGKKKPKEESSCNIMLFAPTMAIYHKLPSFCFLQTYYSHLLSFCNSAWLQLQPIEYKKDTWLQLLTLFFTRVFLGQINNVSGHVFDLENWNHTEKKNTILICMDLQQGCFTRKTFLESKFMAPHMIITITTFFFFSLW